MNRALVVAGAFLLTLSLLSLYLLPYSWTEETRATITTPVVDFELPARQMHIISRRPKVSWAGAGAGWLLILVGVFLPGKEANPSQGRTPESGSSEPSR
jgi:hypothetical protein